MQIKANLHVSGRREMEKEKTNFNEKNEKQVNFLS